MQAQTFAVFISFLVFIFVIDCIRRQKMTFKYSTFWLGTCAAVIFLAFNEKLLEKISKLAGFALPSNFIFFLLFSFFVFLSLLLTIYINEQNNRTENLAQAFGALEYKFKKLEKKISGKDSDSA
ncbi:MAG: hypothetical protein A2036_00080 [Omnitrophica bacterium GWA2_50_21]|nr:MAG: hypothetical protein A2036_00080 [Omnitrophica bacterium GWA2_50_21]